MFCACRFWSRYVHLKIHCTNFKFDLDNNLHHRNAERQECLIQQSLHKHLLRWQLLWRTEGWKCNRVRSWSSITSAQGGKTWTYQQSGPGFCYCSTFRCCKFHEATCSWKVPVSYNPLTQRNVRYFWPHDYEFNILHNNTVTMIHLHICYQT